MSTEPIGFKGTTGIWNIDTDGIYAEDSEQYGNIIADAPTSWEESMKQWDANSKIMAASKKMAVALQDQLQWMETFYDAIKDKEGYSEMSMAILKNKIERAKRVLNDAGVESNIDSMLKGL